MKLELVRDLFPADATLGKLAVDGAFYAYTCEDKDREMEDGGTKIFGKTAIPRGTYKVQVSFSPHFSKDLPELLDVPGFTGIRIHGGNGPADTEGCLLIGRVRNPGGPGYVANCAERVQTLVDLIQQAEDAGEEIWLTIS